MIKGMGIDICQISRMKLSLSKKILTEEEMAFFQGIKLDDRKIEFLAGRFCAKEAIYKALNHMLPKLTMQDITILNDEFGRPQVIRPTIQNLKIFISIAHEKEYAIAEAIVEAP